MPVDQTNKASRFNVVQDLGDVQSMSIVTTQFKLIANSRAIKCQKIEESV